MKKNRFGFPDTPSNKESREKLRLENEILRIKLKARTGGDLSYPGKELPPEIEHLFLKNILAFEESYANSTLISVYDYIGQPPYRREEDMTDEEVEESLARITDIMFSKNLSVDFGAVTDTRRKYSFITGDLFPHEINDVKVGGMFLHFQYEEFNPDHERDMRRKAMEFISDWFERTMGKFSWELAETCVLPDGKKLSKKELIHKFRLIFDSYTSFRDCQYLIKDVFFELQDDGQTGSGHAEGAVKYDALLENGEIQHFEGPFKLFMTLENTCWRICYFVFPGFEW